MRPAESGTAEASAAPAAEPKAGPSAGPKAKAKPTPAPGPAAAPKGDADQAGTGGPEGADSRAEASPQSALDAARELFQHLPPSFRGTLFAGGAPSFGGGMVGGDQQIMSGGRVAGDVFGGSKTEVHHHNVYTSGRIQHPTGEIPTTDIDRLMEYFQPGQSFAAAETCLRESRLVLLRGGRSSGRRSASLALLRSLGVDSPRVLDASVGPDDLLNQTEPAPGYVLWDLRPNLGRELLEARLLTLRGKLAKDGGYLVITTEVASGLSWTVDWTPPPQSDLLTAHLRAALLRAEQADQAERLLALAATTSFLETPRTPGEVADYALLLARHSLGEVTEADLLRSDRAAVEEQVTTWFADGGLDLREQAFLVSLAVFNEAAYALAAEYGDTLHSLLHQLEDPEHPAHAKVFGTSVKHRLAAARATMRTESETVAWGVLRRQTAAFDDPRTKEMLLRQVWLDHPSARPALLDWINLLSADDDPVVRAHAAAATAVLADVDLPSVMPRLLEPWAASMRYRLRNQAINSLALLALNTDTVLVPQILHDWCASPDDEIRWTGVRGHGLIGALSPEEALRDIGDLVVRADEDPDAAGHEPAAQYEAAITSICLLLLTTSRSQVLTRLVSWQQPPGPRAVLGLTAFMAAGYVAEGDAPTPLSWPALLRWYSVGAATAVGPQPVQPVQSAQSAQSVQPVQSVTTLADAAQDRDREHIAALWRAAFASRTHTSMASEVLRDWVRTASRDPACEQHLGDLLRRLAVTATEQDRLSYLLRSLARADERKPDQGKQLAEVCLRLLIAADLPDPDAADRRR